MKKIFLILIIFFSIQIYSQIYDKLELSYEYVDFYSDTNLIGTIKTHTNFDVYEQGYFLSWSSGSERVYHYLYPLSCVYDLNRLTFTRTEYNFVYKSDFKIFKDSIAVYVLSNELRISNKEYKLLRFYNEVNKGNGENDGTRTSIIRE